MERAVETIETVEALFRDHWKTSAAVYLPGGHIPAPGTLFTNRALAATYERIDSEAGAESVESEERRKSASWPAISLARDVGVFDPRIPHARGC